MGASAPPMNMGGFLPIMNASAVLKEQAAEISRRSEAEQTRPVITGLAGHVKSFWQKAEQAKDDVEDDMIEALRARRGEYTAQKAQQIQQQGQPVIYMMLASAKMRQVEALLRDVLIGAGTDKPWTLQPTPDPQLPPMLVQQIGQTLFQEVQMALQSGIYVSVEDARIRLREMRDQVDAKLQEEARVKTERMENKMEDQLVEGQYLDALDQFISDLATYKTAFVAGPIVRKRPCLKWGENGELQVEEKLKLEWERVDPFDVYPAPWARNIQEGPLIRRHKLTRDDLNAMIGVEGYSDASIKQVLAQYGEDGLHNWLSIDSERADAEGKEQVDSINSTGLIDALQYWGSASGQMLLDWGMEPEKVEDPSKEYQIEAWLVGTYVIKAVLNADPLARRPLYACSFQRVPGSVWGNSPYDLMRDCQDMCNAAARALSANLGISSGPQVSVLSDRLPPDEDITTMFPWKIWQFNSDPMGGSSAKPIEFFQPSSNAMELMQVYERFSLLADEYTGIPRYMAGLDSAGAGRTASGMQMMIGNASKVIRQVVGAIDTGILQPLLERLYYYNMRYSEDADLKGDVYVVARGALSLTTKEAAQVRTIEFLAQTLNPLDSQIIGLEGRAELLRHAAKRLDLNPDKVIPPMSVIKERMAVAQIQAMQQQAAMAEQGGEGPDGEQQPGQGEGGGQPPKGSQSKPGQRLQSGGPMTDNFSPPQGV